jgi:hypothetical protein
VWILYLNGKKWIEWPESAIEANYSRTPVTRPIMGPMSDGHVSEVENLGVISWR